MAIDVGAVRSRRAVLSAGLGGLAATAAAVIGRPRPAAATNGEAVILGYFGAEPSDDSGTNESSSTTSIASSADLAFRAASSLAGGTGIQGQGGSGGIGVQGNGGSSGPTIGVRGTSISSSGTGVYGSVALQSGLTYGVHGKTVSTDGLGTGVFGEATAGIGLSGKATTGYALRTDGRIRFDKSAGLATVQANSKKVIVNPGFDLTSSTGVVATLLGNAGTSNAVSRVAIDTSANVFTVYLIAKTPGNVKLAWLVFG